MRWTWTVGLVVALAGCAPGPDGGGDDTEVVDTEVADSVLDTEVVDTVVAETDTVVVDTDTDDTVVVDTDTDDTVVVDTDTDDTLVFDTDADLGETDTADTVVVDTEPPLCTPGDTVACYEGPPGTEGVGICAAGVSTCAPDGASWGPCVDDVLPLAEDCATAEDDNCDGGQNEGCVVTRSYAADVKPIFRAKCAPCHTTSGSGGANLGVSYADTQLASYYCPGETKGACTIVRIHDGTMPLGRGCTGDPVADAGNASCLTAQEQAILQAWIDDGQLP